uniref:UBA domain-containing protein n=1 Tax=Mesocestoides corti TaxID=53468 RepID=A0A5K3FUE1_MESCO
MFSECSEDSTYEAKPVWTAWEENLPTGTPNWNDSMHYSMPKDGANACGPNQQASPKHDMEWAVREVASVCDRDANEIETNIRLLYSNNNCLEEITEALKRARGDRIKAAEFLKQRSNSKKE